MLHVWPCGIAMAKELHQRRERHLLLGLIDEGWEVAGWHHETIL